jgi:hypothetical protein
MLTQDARAGQADVGVPADGAPHPAAWCSQSADRCGATRSHFDPTEPGHFVGITVALDQPTVAPSEAVAAILEELTAAQGAWFGVDLSSVSMEATDTDWTRGTGEVIRAGRGRLVALLCGRTLPDGRALLRSPSTSRSPSRLMRPSRRRPAGWRPARRGSSARSRRSGGSAGLALAQPAFGITEGCGKGDAGFSVKAKTTASQPRSLSHHGTLPQVLRLCSAVPRGYQTEVFLAGRSSRGRQLSADRICSRRMSPCPACRASSRIMCR